jgi:predicted double-glycine peptidase
VPSYKALTPASLLGLSVLSLLVSTSPSAQEPSPRVRSLAEIRHERVIMQQWDISCGAAALATLLTYDLGDPVTERQVASAMLRRSDPIRVRTRGGFSFLNLQEYAEARGYEAEGYGELTMADLAGLVPSIVPVGLNGYNHFVVVRAVRDGTVFFADPSFGNWQLPLRKFEKAWEQRVAFVVTRPALGTRTAESR